MKKILFTVIFLFIASSSFSQNETWFYIRVKDSMQEIPFQNKNGKLDYNGNENKLELIFNNYEIKIFKKTQRKAKPKYLKKTFFVIANHPALLTDLLLNASNIFVSGEIIPLEERKIYEPNDYGLTSTIGENIGLPINFDYLDVLGCPQAWYYTTGEKDVIAAVSDGTVNIELDEFKGKSTRIHKSDYANGHGDNIAFNGFAQGDNGKIGTGVCFDCPILATKYGDFRKLSEVKEAAAKGAKVISCSWVGSTKYDYAEKVVDSLFNKNIVIVAAAGNKGFHLNKGEMVYYPAGYDNVISVSSGMYRHEKALDNIQLLGDTLYYTSNLRGSVGRTMGFPENDTLREPFVYPVSTAILHESVDILAPTAELFTYNNYLNKGEIIYYPFSTTSGATPLVSGTVGLMFSLYPCLPAYEVVSILKMTALNIDNVPGNKIFYGLYGAGLLQTGKAVKLVNDLHDPNEIAYIENQDFVRWNFKISGISKEIVLRNQKFREKATLDILAKNRIRIAGNTVLKPNSEGKIRLHIQSKLENECDLRRRVDK